jgi:hypothetical protein
MEKINHPAAPTCCTQQAACRKGDREHNEQVSRKGAAVNIAVKVSNHTGQNVLEYAREQTFGQQTKIPRQSRLPYIQ